MIAQGRPAEPASEDEDGIPIRSIARALVILQVVNSGPSMSLMEISRAADLPYPTVVRIIRTLVHEGMLEREPSQKRYRPTPLVQTLSHGYQEHSRLSLISRPILVRLTQQLGWPLTISTPLADRMITRDTTHSLTSLSLNNYYPGFSYPMIESAGGRAYLAWVSLEKREQHLASRSMIGRATSISDAREHISNVLDAVKEHGFALVERNMFTKPAGRNSSIALPVLQDGHAIAAISVIYFAVAMRAGAAIDAFVAPLRGAAAEISEALAQEA